MDQAQQIKKRLAELQNQATGSQGQGSRRLQAAEKQGPLRRLHGRKRLHHVRWHLIYCCVRRQLWHRQGVGQNHCLQAAVPVGGLLQKLRPVSHKKPFLLPGAAGGEKPADLLQQRIPSAGNTLRPHFRCTAERAL